MSKLIQLASMAGLVLGVSVLSSVPSFSAENEYVQMVDLTAMPVVERREQVSCRTVQPTGTHLYMHVCMTVGDWEDMREDSRVAVEALLGTGTEIGT